MQDTYENFKSRCFLNDLPNEQYFIDNKINLISTRSINIDNKHYAASQDTYNTNNISYVNLTLYKFIYSIRQVDTTINNYIVFNIVIIGIKHTDFNKSDTLTMDAMSSLCLEKSDDLAKVMSKFLKGK